MKRAVTLIELLVAVALSTLLVGVVAMLFLQATDTRKRVMDSIANQHRLRATTEDVGGNCRRAVAIAELERFLHVSRVVAPLAQGGEARIDSLELTRLGDDGRLQRVRYWVEWDAVRENGTLWRDTAPVEATELPLSLRFLASVEPPESDVVLSGVRGFQIQLDGPTGFVDPPTDPADDWCQEFVITGLESRLLHDRLRVDEPLFEPLDPHGLVFLRDDRVDHSAIDEGYYPIRRVEPAALTFSRRIGECRHVFYQAAWLPDALSLTVTAGGEAHTARLEMQPPRLEHMLLLDGQEPLGVLDRDE